MAIPTALIVLGVIVLMAFGILVFKMGSGSVGDLLSNIFGRGWQRYANETSRVVGKVRGENAYKIKEGKVADVLVKTGLFKTITDHNVPLSHRKHYEYPDTPHKQGIDWIHDYSLHARDPFLRMFNEIYMKMSSELNAASSLLGTVLQMRDAELNPDVIREHARNINTMIQDALSTAKARQSDLSQIVFEKKEETAKPEEKKSDHGQSQQKPSS